MSEKQATVLRKAIILFNERQYFECHEVLEDLWRPLPPGVEKAYLQGLIQVAVGLHHLQRNNFIGARNKLQSALEKLEAVQRDAAIAPAADTSAPSTISFQPPIALSGFLTATHAALEEVLRLGPEALAHFPQALLPTIQIR